MSRLLKTFAVLAAVGVAGAGALARPRHQPERIVTTAFTTAYTWYDNTPPGSGRISHPVLHQRAGGIGTYRDPVTVAVGHTLTRDGRDLLDYKPGTRIYIPNMRRYFIVEDTCGDGPRPQDGPCHSRLPKGTTTWLDMWIDGHGGTPRQVARCAARVTGGPREAHTIILNPRRDYAVSAGPITSDGGCTRVYGNARVRNG